ncbi:hypothetical protein ACIBK8_09610 [Streptomyces sp. NPDC050161]|uniref:hypothetical protein n=1 Tax=Streptomyces sp. NPDC050161 TaxID=3365604 RepID=UPI00378890AE
MADVRHPGAMLRRAWLVNRPLTATGVLMAALLVATSAGVLLDLRAITGQPAWAKPSRFALSICLYSFTLLWLLTFVRGHDRLVRLVSLVTGVALTVEMVLIAGAAAAGTTSHFNFTTAATSAVWLTMGGFILLTWVMNLVAAVLLLLQRMDDRVLAWGLRLGVFIAAVGMAVAFLMTLSTPRQDAAAAAGRGMPIGGAHTVGPDDGGPGLPVTNWSTVGGDLRVPHFVGLHALQVLPLVGLLLTLGPRRLAPRYRTALVWIAALTYLGVMIILTWQALRAQPVTSPDGPTAGAFLALVAAACAAVAVVFRRARTSAR